MSNNNPWSFDPAQVGRFTVTILGIGQIGVATVSGFTDTSGTVEYREGHEPIRPREISTLSTFSRLTISRGVAFGSTDFMSWRDDARKYGSEGEGVRKTVIIEVGSNGGAFPLRRLKLFNAWPVSMTLSDLNAASNEVWLESLELSFQDFKFEDGINYGEDSWVGGTPIYYGEDGPVG